MHLIKKFYIYALCWLSIETFESALNVVLKQSAGVDIVVPRKTATIKAIEFALYFKINQLRLAEKFKTEFKSGFSVVRHEFFKIILLFTDIGRAFFIFTTFRNQRCFLFIVAVMAGLLTDCTEFNRAYCSKRTGKARRIDRFKQKNKQNELIQYMKPLLMISPRLT